MYHTGPGHALGVVDAPFIGSLISAGLGAAGNALNRGAANRAGQQNLDVGFQRDLNNFTQRTGGKERFGDVNAFKSRLLGNLGKSQGSTTFGNPSKGTGFTTSGLDFSKLFNNINAGGFGDDLAGRTKADITKDLNFDAPKFESGSSFLGDLLGGAGAAAGQINFGGGDGPPDPDEFVGG